jgi:NarL family two-component system response regulator LiaR
MIRVVIVDDHTVVRQGLRFMLEQRAEVEVVGEGSDGEQAIALAGELVPDVLLLDLLMPKLDGIAAVRAIKRLTPTTQIIILTSYYEDDQIFNAIKAGALSYLLKDASAHDLVEAVCRAARGESMLHPLVAARVLQEIRHREHPPSRI